MTVLVMFEDEPNNPAPESASVNFGQVVAGNTSPEKVRYVSHTNTSEIFDVKLFITGTDAATIAGWASAGKGGIFVKEGASTEWVALSGTSYDTGYLLATNGGKIPMHDDPNQDGIWDGEVMLTFKVQVPSDAVAKQYSCYITAGFKYYEG